MAVPSSLNPWQERGIPLERQYRSWKQIVKDDPRASAYREAARHFDIYSNGEILVVTNQ